MLLMADGKRFFLTKIQSKISFFLSPFTYVYVLTIFPRCGASSFVHEQCVFKALILNIFPWLVYLMSKGCFFISFSLNTSNVGINPYASLGATALGDVYGLIPPFSVFISYLNSKSNHFP